MDGSRAAGKGAFVAAAAFCIGGVGLLIYFQLGGNTHLSVRVPGTGNASAQSQEEGSVAEQPQAGTLEVNTDDRTVAYAQYQASLDEQVSHLIHEAANMSDGEILAGERSLPTLALPILQREIAKNPVPPAVAAALASDGVRLGNALNVEKRRLWYDKTALAIFDKRAKGKTWKPAARAAVMAGIQEWSEDPAATGDEVE
jgi:hypothetical protein